MIHDFNKRWNDVTLNVVCNAKSVTSFKDVLQKVEKKEDCCRVAMSQKRPNGNPGLL